jgi:flagellar protein FlaF
MPARETEIAAFAAINRQMENATDGAARIRAAGRNHDLWSTLVKDLGLDENKLPAPLKQQLIAIGFWSMRYSTLAILNNLPLEPLVAVNRNIAEGLALQGEAAKAASHPHKADAAL